MTASAGSSRRSLAVGATSAPARRGAAFGCHDVVNGYLIGRGDVRDAGPGRSVSVNRVILLGTSA